MAPPLWTARPPDEVSALCAPNAAPSASIAPCAVSAAAGDVRSEGSRPSSTWMRALASVWVVEPMAQGPPRLLQPKADARIRPGRPVASKSTLKAVPGVADSATTGWPVAGQLQRQPAPSRTEVERSACTVPPSSQVVGVNMAIAASCASWRDRNDVAAVSAVGRQSAPMRWFRLSCATAH